MSKHKATHLFLGDEREVLKIEESDCGSAHAVQQGMNARLFVECDFYAPVWHVWALVHEEKQEDGSEERKTKAIYHSKRKAKAALKTLKEVDTCYRWRLEPRLLYVGAREDRFAALMARANARNAAEKKRSGRRKAGVR